MRYSAIIISIFLSLLTSCTARTEISGTIEGVPDIFPDYAGVTVPSNIAPLNFRLDTQNEAALIIRKGDDSVLVKGPEFKIPEKVWKTMTAGGGDVTLRVLESRDGRWLSYAPFNITVTESSIDRFITYRLIEPGYETWNEMGIYQRDLETFWETAVIRNTETGKNCMNCHSFSNRSHEQMVFHMRGENGGTYVVKDGTIEKLNTKTPQTISALVYPQWSPDGRFIVFSVNDTFQAFHSTSTNRIEVYDAASDVVVYDVEHHTIFSSPLLMSPDRFETFPSFSPDGNAIFFCSSPAVEMPDRYRDVRYTICSIAFDPDSKTFSEKVDTVFSGHSCTFPRVSPDGRYLMFTEAAYGNFHIWHRDADLRVLNLQTGSLLDTDIINSSDVDSYHSWSSDGHWVVFSSRRIDGLYTRPFITYLNEDGTFTKPFLIPQKDSHYYDRLFKSYNIPEFVDGRVAISEKDIAYCAINSPGTALTFENYE